jgi:hypothetical protein
VNTAETVETWSGAAASIATVAAIGIGGWWTYLRFIKERTGDVRASLSESACHRVLTDTDSLLRVVVAVENTGQVLLPIEKLRCEIYQVAPLDEAASMLQSGELISEYEAQLPCLEGYEREWGPGTVRIEPGESDTFAFDFVVSRDVATILVYAHVPNVTEDDGEIGWDISSFYDFAD